MQNFKKTIVTLTALSGMCLAGAHGLPAGQHNKSQQKTTKASAAAKHRVAKLNVDPNDITIDSKGNVLIKDAPLAKELKGRQADNNSILGDICCGGCGCK